MNNETETKKVKIDFEVSVWTETMPPVFTYKDNNDWISNGNVTIDKQDIIRIITYTLTEKHLSFYCDDIKGIKGAVITNGPYDELKHRVFTVNHHNDTLEMTFTPSKAESFGVQLIVKNELTDHLYASPDPQLKAKYVIE